jgi:anthranilate phosphoribosyltransferase
VARCIREAGVGFMMAPTHHASMRHVAPVRVELGTRTIFNILGPLSNPAGVTRQVVGVFAPSWMEPVARTLMSLGTTAAWIVHGADGLDELTTTGPTHVVAIRNGGLTRFDITPEEAGLSRARLDDLKGGDPDTNAQALRSVLAGERNAYRDIAALNAAAGLLVAEKVTSLSEGVNLAQTVIDSGKAAATLDHLVKLSNE